MTASEIVSSGAYSISHGLVPSIVEQLPSRETLRQAVLQGVSPTLSGVIADETPGRGTDRPELIGRCIKPDGGNDRADLASAISFAGPFTVSWRAKRDNTSDFDFVAGNSVNTSKLGYNTGTHQGFFRVLDGGSADNTTDLRVDTTQWHQVTLTRDANNKVDLYVNGLLRARLFSDAAQSGAATFGRLLNDSSGVQAIGGTVWDIQFINSALTASEVYQLYSLCEFALPNTPRVAWYNCESQHPTLLLDSSGNNRHATCSNHTATVGNFFYEGNDVPGSYLNKVGYGQYLILTRTGTSWAGGVYGTEWISGEFDMQIVANATALAEQFLGFTTSTTDLTAATYNGTNLAFHITGAGTYVRVDGTPVGASGGVMVAGDVARITRDSNGLVSFYLNDTLLHSLTDTRSVRVIGTTTLTGYSFPLSLTIGGAWANLSRLRTSGPSYNVVNYSRKESDKTKDILGSPLQYTGEAPRHAKLENNNCGTFDGSNDVVTVASSGGVIGSAMTVAGWVKFNRISGDSIVSKGLNNQWALFFQSGIGGLVWRANGTGSDVTHTVTADGLWHHVAVTQSGTTAKLYVDGVLVKTGTANALPAANAALVQIGQLDTIFPSQNSKAGIRVYTRELTAAEVLNIKNGVEPSTTSLLIYLPFSEGKGTDVHNVVPGGAHGAASGIDETLYWGTKQPNFAYNSAKGSALVENLFEWSEPASNPGSTSGFTFEATTGNLALFGSHCIRGAGGASAKWAYDTLNVEAKNYLVECYMEMDDGSQPVVSTDSNSAATDFVWVFKASIAAHASAPVYENVIGNVWKVSVVIAATAGSGSCGPVQYANNSGKAFRMTALRWTADLTGASRYTKTAGASASLRRIPAALDGLAADSSTKPALRTLTYAPSPGVWPLSEATLNSNPNNAPRRGTPGPTAFHPVTAPGSNPTFFRRRTKNSQLVGIDRFLQYSETLSGTRLTQAQTFTAEKAL